MSMSSVHGASVSNDVVSGRQPTPEESDDGDGASQLERSLERNTAVQGDDGQTSHSDTTGDSQAPLPASDPDARRAAGRR